MTEKTEKLAEYFPQLLNVIVACKHVTKTIASFGTDSTISAELNDVRLTIAELDSLRFFDCYKTAVETMKEHKQSAVDCLRHARMHLTELHAQFELYRESNAASDCAERIADVTDTIERIETGMM